VFALLRLIVISQSFFNGNNAGETLWRQRAVMSSSDVAGERKSSEAWASFAGRVLVFKMYSAQRSSNCRFRLSRSKEARVARLYVRI